MATGNSYTELIHHFPENGIKWLLRNSTNVRDALALVVRGRRGFPDLSRFIFADMTIEPGTFIREDFRHGLSDLLVKMPFRAEPNESKHVAVYFLFEHLSQHHRPIIARLLGYVMDAYREQERHWRTKHDSLDGILYQPVLPIVFHTGLQPWRKLTPFKALVEQGEAFSDLIPRFEPLFLSLPAQSDANLANEGGEFGQILRLLQHRGQEPNAFHSLLATVVQSLENQLATNDPNRLTELLRYASAMVYHYRRGRDGPRSHEIIMDSIRTQFIRKEVNVMEQTYAEILREEGEIRGRQQTLLRQLRRKFDKKVSPRVAKLIEKTQNIEQLETWLDNILVAQSIDDVGLEPAK